MLMHFRSISGAKFLHKCAVTFIFSPLSTSCRVGDILLSINDVQLIGHTSAKAESVIKALPRGIVRFTAMAPPRDVTGRGFKPKEEKLTQPPPPPPSTTPPPHLPPHPSDTTPSGRQIVEDEGVVKVQVRVCMCMCAFL